MSGYGKRRSSDSLGGDRKRIPFERYDYGSYIKQEYNNAQSNNGRQSYVDHQQSYVAVPYNYNYATPSAAPIVASVGLQSAVVCNKPQRYYSSQYVEPSRSDDRNVFSSIKNYSSGYNDAISAAYYDKQRQLNFKHEVYINSLRQSEPRIVNYNDLRRHLSDIDIKFVYNWNFSTALDLTLELESSLNYFVDTRNELVFLRKMQRQQCIPFSYNEINITNQNGLYNRMRFLENESAYRSNRMNLLFNQLQSVVIPSIIDDIRFVHSISYEKSWVNRARYWFSLFKQIKWGNRVNYDRPKFQQAKHRRPHRRYATKDEVYPIDNVNIKSETGTYQKDLPIDAKTVKIEKSTKLPPRDTVLPNQDPIMPCDNRIETALNTVEHTIVPDVRNDNSVFEPSHQGITVETKGVDDVEDVGADKESDHSNSCVIVEQDVCLVTVIDDNRRDSVNITNPPEGDTVKESN